MAKNKESKNVKHGTNEEAYNNYTAKNAKEAEYNDHKSKNEMTAENKK